MFKKARDSSSFRLKEKERGKCRSVQIFSSYILSMAFLANKETLCRIFNAVYRNLCIFDTWWKE
jgi:hypothetical protein